MSRLNVANPEQATGAAKALYDGIKRAIGGVPNIHRGIANSPAALEGLLAAGQAVFTNLFNRVHQTPLDFPAAPAL